MCVVMLRNKLMKPIWLIMTVLTAIGILYVVGMMKLLAKIERWWKKRKERKDNEEIILH